MDTMQGIVITGPGKFEYQTGLPVPVPGPGEVRLKVLAAGICGTDIHIARGDESLMSLISPPMILGHEFCGEVDAFGKDVNGFKVGEYVSAEMHEVCYKCRACRDKKYHACEGTKIHGLQLNGAFADFVVVSATNVVKLPASIPVKVAAVMDALGNAVHTVCKTDTRDRDVAIIGYGPIGAMAAEVAIFGNTAHLYIIDINKRALERAKLWVEARKLSSRVTVLDGSSGDCDRHILELSKGGCDAALDFSGAPSGINMALNITRAGGEVALLGIPKQSDITLRDYGKNVIMKGLTMHGVIGREMFGTWTRMIEMLGKGLDIGGLITGEYPLKDFATGLRRFAEGEEQKVVLYPQGKQ